MDNAALFSVRPEAARKIKVTMKPHQLPQDAVGSYKYKYAVKVIEIKQGVLKDQNLKDTTEGMKGLMDKNPHTLTEFKANIVIKATNVKQESDAAAAWVGRNITKPILRHADGVQFKKVDKCQLYQLVTAIMEGAERPDPGLDPS